jgi:hypothetical protein
VILTQEWKLNNWTIWLVVSPISAEKQAITAGKQAIKCRKAGKMPALLY